MKNGKNFNMPVQGKGIPRHGATSDYNANVEASINWGSVLGTAAKIGKGILGAVL